MAQFPLVILDQIEWIDTASQLRIDRCQKQVNRMMTVLMDLDSQTVRGARSRGGAPKFDHPFPPIVLFTDGGINSQHFIGDGYHRFHSYRQAGREAIPAEVTVCDAPRFEAFKYALSANHRNDIDPLALDLTSSDRANRIRQALACDRLRGMSHSDLAALCHVDEEYVRNLAVGDQRVRTKETVPTKARRAAVLQVLSEPNAERLTLQAVVDKAAALCGQEVSRQTVWNIRNEKSPKPETDNQKLRKWRRRFRAALKEAAGDLTKEQFNLLWNELSAHVYSKVLQD